MFTHEEGIKDESERFCNECTEMKRDITETTNIDVFSPA